ncbi:MAG: histidinol phosphatase [Chloroflexia bacterium]|nr:histidinol phosphatase [Chloroflexia bacterium]
MLPEFIVERALELDLDIIAVTDHNSAENAAAMVTAATDTGLTVLPGMEVQTREEVHLVCLFDTLEQAWQWQEEVYAHLPRLKNKEEVFGTQIVLDAEGQAQGYNERLLLTSTSFSLEQVLGRVGQIGGLCIPAHVDRPAYSIMANLGFIPPELDFPGVEISQLVKLEQARQRFPQLEQYSLIANGDAHRLNELVRRTTFKMQAPTVAEIALALAGEGGRGVWVDGKNSGRVTASSGVTT